METGQCQQSKFKVPVKHRNDVITNIALCPTDLKEKYDAISVEDFLKLFKNPLAHFLNLKRTASSLYKEHATAYVKRFFPYHPSASLEKLLRDNSFLLAPTVQAVKACNFSLRKTRRSAYEIHEPSQLDETFLQEVSKFQVTHNVIVSTSSCVDFPGCHAFYVPVNRK